ncbi:GTP cyclohydrolase II-domain-containing protein [Aspergillus germanicus]
MYTTESSIEKAQAELGEYKLMLKATSLQPFDQTPPPTPAPEFSQHATPIHRPPTTGSDSSTRPHTTPVKVECTVRAQIPTTLGVDMWLHLYRNNADAKEHLAIVFGNRIRSHSLDCVRGGETELDLMIRGAYTGRLRPGRISSRHCSGGTDYKPNSCMLASESSSSSSSPTLVRVHSECYTGETTWSARCDCGSQLDDAARMTAAAGEGVIVYLRQEGRGIGLADKLRAYNLQDLSLDTVDANLFLGRPSDARVYGVASAILLDLGLGKKSAGTQPGSNRGIRLLTNNPEKLSAIQNVIPVKERVALAPVAWQATGSSSSGDAVDQSPELYKYSRTKVDRMGHLIGKDDFKV